MRRNTMSSIVACILFGLQPCSTAAVQKRSFGNTFKAGNGTWTNLTSLPHAWQEHSTVHLNNNIYIMGGVPPIPRNGSLDNLTLRDVARYSIPADSWEMITPMPAALNHANAVAHDGKIYVLGGLAPQADQLDWVPNNSSFVFDPRKRQWSDLPSIPAEFTRGSAAMASWGDEIVLAGGLAELSLESGVQLSIANVSAYNVLAQTWRVLPPLPEARDHDGYAVIGSKFYVIGGRVNGQYNVRNTTFVMDLTEMEAGWKALAPMPTARGGCTAGAIGDVIYVFGGEADTAPGTNGVYPQVEAYDTIADTWRKLPDMPVPRHGTVATATDCGIYVPGGGVAISDAAVDHFDVFRP